ncbi:MAG: sulfurtransferase [Phycisphaerae bacterium]
MTMNHTTLIDATSLAGLLDSSDVVVVDCRFSIKDPQQGPQAYRAGHIPGAVYADLNKDLSGPIMVGVTGRHPLPDMASFAETLSRWGIDGDVQVVAYDDATAAPACRLWWMLKWMGHDRVAVLNGGWSHWQRSGLPKQADVPTPKPRTFHASPRPELIISAREAAEFAENPNRLLVDSRAAARYRGEVEPIDPVAGHIPGAINGPYEDNLDESGLLRDVPSLAARFDRLFGTCQANDVAFYCGSGVSAANNLLACVHAGRGLPKLYPGSWSEWIADPKRPIATG